LKRKTKFIDTERKKFREYAFRRRILQNDLSKNPHFTRKNR